MNTHISLVESGKSSVSDVVQTTLTIQEVMKSVMISGVHYGVLPGTDKPTLYKSGAEKLCLAFHIADEYSICDLSTEEYIRYRITCVGKHQFTGVVMGSGIGEASTFEEKYKWRRVVCAEEYDATPLSMRRIKYSRGKGGTVYKQEQVRTEPFDLANTVLKMAAKRAKMAMVLNTVAASDAFTQDLEDLSEELRTHLTSNDDDFKSTSVRDKWLAKVAACDDLVELADLASAKGPAVQELHKARDTEGYSIFAQAIKARGVSLREKQSTSSVSQNDEASITEPTSHE
jgi:hypothetical protein